jgi:hypothetical protein
MRLVAMSQKRVAPSSGVTGEVAGDEELWRRWPSSTIEDDREGSRGRDKVEEIALLTVKLKE